MLKYFYLFATFRIQWCLSYLVRTGRGYYPLESMAWGLVITSITRPNVKNLPCAVCTCILQKFQACMLHSD